MSERSRKKWDLRWVSLHFESDPQKLVVGYRTYDGIFFTVLDDLDSLQHLDTRRLIMDDIRRRANQRFQKRVGSAE